MNFIRYIISIGLGGRLLLPTCAAPPLPKQITTWRVALPESLKKDSRQVADLDQATSNSLGVCVPIFSVEYLFPEKSVNVQPSGFTINNRQCTWLMVLNPTHVTHKQQQDFSPKFNRVATVLIKHSPVLAIGAIMPWYPHIEESVISTQLQGFQTGFAATLQEYSDFRLYSLSLYQVYFYPLSFILYPSSKFDFRP